MTSHTLVSAIPTNKVSDDAALISAYCRVDGWSTDTVLPTIMASVEAASRYTP